MSVMDIEIETRKETNKLVKWTVAVPRIGMSVESKFFQVHGNKWNLKFCTNFSSQTEYWCMMLYNSDNKGFTRFPLKVYIRHDGKDLYLGVKEIISRSTEIWRSYYSNFQIDYPNIVVVGTYLQFVFDFHLRIRNPKSPITVEKSVQTSVRNPENHPCLENLSLDLSKLIESGTDTDVQLKCGDVSIGAHKMVLGARSEVFRTMMQSDMVEGRDGTIKIIDMEPNILKIFIRYLYTGMLPELAMETALPIYEAADKYQVEALKKRSSHLLVKHLSPENALAILVAADAHSDNDLKDKLISYVSEEKITNRKVEWLKFCNECPKLANEVLNFMIYQENPSN